MLPKIIREFRVAEITEDLKVGEKINPEVFSVGDVVHVTGTSKGKGWAGTIRRHNFHRSARRTVVRVILVSQVLSVLCTLSTFLRARKWPVSWVHEQVTVRNLKVALVDAEQGVIGVTGAVPGPRKGIVMI